MEYNFSGIVVSKNFSRRPDLLFEALGWRTQFNGTSDISSSLDNNGPADACHVYFTSQATYIFVNKDYVSKHKPLPEGQVLEFVLSEQSKTHYLRYSENGDQLREILALNESYQVDKGDPLPLESGNMAINYLILQLMAQVSNQDFNTIEKHETALQYTILETQTESTLAVPAPTSSIAPPEEKKEVFTPQSEGPSRMQRNHENEKYVKKSTPTWKLFLGTVIFLIAAGRLGYTIYKLTASTDPDRSRGTVEMDSTPTRKLYPTLSRTEISSLGGERTTGDTLRITDRAAIVLTDGFYTFPSFQTEETPLVAYSRGYLLVYCKLPIIEGVVAAQHWQDYQESIQSSFPRYPFTNIDFLDSGDMDQALGIDSNLRFHHSWDERLRSGILRVIEQDGYRHFIAFTGPKKDFQELQRYLKWYVRSRR